MRARGSLVDVVGALGGLLVLVVGLVFRFADPIASIVSLVWLGMLGHFWWTFGCLALSAVAAWPLGYLMMPAMFLAAPVVAAERRGSPPSRIVLLSLPAQLYTAAAVTVWCMGAFTLLFKGATQQTWLRLVLLSFAVGTFPFDYMASWDRRPHAPEDSPGAFTLTFFMKLAFVVSIAYLVLERPHSFLPLWITFTATMLVGVAWASADAYRKVAMPAGDSAQHVARSGLPSPMTPKYYLLDREQLARVDDQARMVAFIFRDGKWVSMPHVAAVVTGMGGDADFEDLSEEKARKLFPGAFP